MEKAISFLCGVVLMFLSTSCFAAEGQIQSQNVVWGDLYERHGAYYLPGGVTSDQGNLKIHLKYSLSSGVQLITMESFGAGELSPREVKLYVVISKDNSWELYRERLPYSNEFQPATLQKVATISNETLQNGISKMKTGIDP